MKKKIYYKYQKNDHTELTREKNLRTFIENIKYRVKKKEAKKQKCKKSPSTFT